MLGAPSKLAWTSALIAVLGVGCTAGRDEAATPQGEWLVEAIAGEAAADGVRTTLAIAEDGTVSGSGGCNRYGGRAEIGDGAIAFGPLAATKMMCLPAMMDQETAFFDALEQAAGWEIVDGKLLLLDGRGGTLVAFSSA